MSHAKFLQSINGGDVATAAALIEGDIELNLPCDQGASPFFAAIINGHLYLVHLMLTRGADPNFVAAEPADSIYAEKPLDLALQARLLLDFETYDPIVEILIQFGAT